MSRVFKKLFKRSKQVPEDSSEDHLEMLSKYDTIIIMDDSGSMRGPRWKEARKALETLATVAAKYDEDGIEIRFLNSESTVTTADPGVISALFDRTQPDGATPIGRTLQRLLNTYIADYETAIKDGKKIKPINCIVVTDGVPSDAANNTTKDVISHACHQLDNLNAPIHQVGIQFVQIGEDESAKKFLDDLDNEMSAKTNDHRDIVDTVPHRQGKKLDLVQVLTGGVNRKVDKQNDKS